MASASFGLILMSPLVWSALLGAGVVAARKKAVIIFVWIVGLALFLTAFWGLFDWAFVDRSDRFIPADNLTVLQRYGAELSGIFYIITLCLAGFLVGSFAAMLMRLRGGRKV